MNSRRNTFLENTDAVSEIIGEVLMTAIAVLAFSVVAVFIFSYASPQEKVHADIQGWADVDSDTIYLRHTGGETIDVSGIRIVLNINGTRRDLTSSELIQIKGNTAWNLGETIRINTSELWSDSIGQNDYVGIVMITTDSNFVLKSGTLLGDVSNVISSTNGSTPTPTLTAPVLSGQNPLTSYQSNTSQSVTFSAISSQSSINEFLLNGQHLAWSNGTSPFYTNTSAFAGTYTLTLVAKNTTDQLLTDSLEWTWTVISETTPANGSGINMHLLKANIGGYVANGDYIKFKTGGGGSSITINGVTKSIKNNDNVMFVMNGQQPSGQAIIGGSGVSWQITAYDFNVDFYLNNVLEETGDITNIYISKADNFESTISYYLPSDLSQTYFSENGDANVLINGIDDSEIWLYNVTPADGNYFMFEFNSTYTNIEGFDANHMIN
ncbi:type IV pilin N-terminal domain-containing protein [Methanolobus mangrovi]|uniref:Type IV pilin N-terminal domain-containing protein n=1 Tax=Methanolobus mangrovi TaxID=3072977 RepID=A0AA51YHJ5_9EURY|nr:type IV pilin N-terminal domain-containing protein [Methanolobus mangrovi]WMW23222.1 type IV pilin N-terminal domain-containing protein [Methanolobus mangrovi]